MIKKRLSKNTMRIASHRETDRFLSGGALREEENKNGFSAEHRLSKK